MDTSKADDELSYDLFKYTYLTIGRYIRFILKVFYLSFNQIMFGGSIHPVTIAPAIIYPLASSFALFMLMLYCIYARFMRGENKTLSEAGSRVRHLHSDPLAKGKIKTLLHPKHLRCAKIALSQPIVGAKTDQEKRIFNLDIAKFMLQLSAIMYENDPLQVLRGMKKIKKYYDLHVNDLGGQATQQLASAIDLDHNGTAKTFLDNEEFTKARDLLYDNRGDAAIRKQCETWGIEYEPVSRLNSSSASFASVFWQKDSNWIVVAFKGTGPTDFTEWITDFDYNLVPGGSWLRGFGRVHGGFADRIFPRKVSKLAGKRPYDIIANAVKIVAEDLKKAIEEKNKAIQESNNKATEENKATNENKATHENKVGSGTNNIRDKQTTPTEINVWFTGHSLGTAIASLAYARAITGKNDFGKGVIVRDAYLFATPILCDVASVHSFNWSMFKNFQKPRTMWRITNRNDAVATLLPSGGDLQHVPDPDHPYTFAHLGTEIKLPDNRKSPVASGNHITQGLGIEIVSGCSDTKLDKIERRMSLEHDDRQSWPVLGSLFAHSTGNYWNSLAKVRPTPKNTPLMWEEERGWW